MNFWQIFELILGTAESIVPIFIHNPQSQKIEAMIVTSANNALNIAQQMQAQNQAATK